MTEPHWSPEKEAVVEEAKAVRILEAIEKQQSQNQFPWVVSQCASTRVYGTIMYVDICHRIS